MALTDAQKRSLLDEINRCEKKIVDIQTKAQKDIGYEQKKIQDARNKLAKG